MQKIRNNSSYFINAGHHRAQILKAFSQAEDQLHRLRSPFQYIRGYIFVIIAAGFLVMHWWILGGIILAVYLGIATYVHKQHKDRRELIEGQLEELQDQFPDLWKQYKRAKDSKPTPKGMYNIVKARANAAIKDYKVAYQNRKKKKRNS